MQLADCAPRLAFQYRHRKKSAGSSSEQVRLQQPPTSDMKSPNTSNACIRTTSTASKVDGGSYRKPVQI